MKVATARYRPVKGGVVGAMSRRRQSLPNEHCRFAAARCRRDATRPVPSPPEEESRPLPTDARRARPSRVTLPQAYAALACAGQRLRVITRGR